VAGYKAPVRGHPLLPGQLGPAARALAAALGVTRIARLTGLDRTGVEVVSAVRPGGHVLQVTSGKGATPVEAARGALGEAAELWAAERPAPVVLASATATEARAHAGPRARVLSHAELGAEESRRCDWRTAALLGGGAALVPADAVHCPPSGGACSPAWSRWTSNGMGAHPARPAAVLHALLEVVERDRLARALPEGFTERAVSARLLAADGLARAAPRTAALRAALRARGFRVHLLDLSAAPAVAPLGLPVAAAILLDEEGGPVPVAAGYACRLGRDAALEAALLEAVQSRATEIHGAREDVAWGDRAAARPLAALLDGARARRPVSALPDRRAASPAAAVALVVRRLAGAGFPAAAVATLAAPSGLHVVKVLVPGLLLSELLC
jgi:ribosomal protein S12 methylthiotransferase accessory factor